MERQERQRLERVRQQLRKDLALAQNAGYTRLEASIRRRLARASSQLDVEDDILGQEGEGT